MDYGLETLVDLNSNLKYPKTLLKVLVKARLPAIAIPGEEVTVKRVPWTLMIIECEVC